MSYRTRVRQAPYKRGSEGSWLVEVYLAGVGWLPLADASGRAEARFATRKAARGHAGCVEQRSQVLGAKHLR